MYVNIFQKLGIFLLLERLYVFISRSPVHKKWEEAQNELYPVEPARQLQRFSYTRWTVDLSYSFLT